MLIINYLAKWLIRQTIHYLPINQCNTTQYHHHPSSPPVTPQQIHLRRIPLRRVRPRHPQYRGSGAWLWVCRWWEDMSQARGEVDQGLRILAGLRQGGPQHNSWPPKEKVPGLHQHHVLKWRILEGWVWDTVGWVLWHSNYFTCPLSQLTSSQPCTTSHDNPIQSKNQTSLPQTKPAQPNPPQPNLAQLVFPNDGDRWRWLCVRELWL